MSLISYLKETRAEMKHMSWPTRSQVASYTLVVIALSIIASLYLGFFDFIFSKVLDAFFIK